MPHKCDYCGEYAPCRKEPIYNGLTTRKENFMWNNYICEKCDRANKLLRKKEEAEEQKEIEESQRAWIKERDKILKEHEMEDKEK